MASFTCPGCGTRYNLPHGAGGKKVRCNKCGAIARVPEDEFQLLPDDGPIPIADGSNDFFAEAAAAAAGPTIPVAPPEPPSPGAMEDADAYVRAGHVPDRRGAGHTFWGDVGWSFLIITQPSNMIVFVIVWVLNIIWFVVGWAPCIGTLARLIVFGWIWAFYFKCVAETAAGDDDLPTLKLTEGVWDDIVLPIIKIVAATVLTVGPSIIYLIVAGAVFGGGALAGLGTLTAGNAGAVAAAIAVPFFGLLIAGVFLWPITILVLALGNVVDTFRLDLLVRTVIRSFLPYLAVCLLVAAAIGLQWSVVVVLAGGLGLGTIQIGPMAATVLGLGVTAYSWIVVMRIIGLYYRHFKRRFAWEWE